MHPLPLFQKFLSHVKKSIPALVIAAAVIATSGGLHAARADATITVSGAPLSVTTNNIAFNPVTLNGSLIVSNGTTSAWTMKDPTGTGSGWHTTITATNFVDSNAHTISVTGFKMLLSNGAITTVDGNAAPTSSFTSSTVLSGSPQSFLAAAADSGMGTYTALPTFTLDVPASTYAGSYVSTVTVTIISGP